jgi:molybdenum-dependent DNA-binding transcriptional regulator ModE
MPQPIATQDQWNQVRDTAVACGSIKEAAAVHGVSYQAAKQRAKREAWPVARRLNRAIVQARLAASRSLEAATGRVTSVTSTPDALVSIMAEHEQKTKLSLSKASMNMAQQAETAPLEQAPDVHSVAKTAAIVHRWGNEQGNSILNVRVLAMGKAAFTYKPEGQASGRGN